MIILSIRTDKPESEVGLYNDSIVISYVKWSAHRMLAETIHQKIEEILLDNHIKLNDVDGVIFYKGPGSFTGLRIGASVAGALAYSYGFPLASESGDRWIINGIKNLKNSKSSNVASIDYGDSTVTTTQKR